MRDPPKSKQQGNEQIIRTSSSRRGFFFLYRNRNCSFLLDTCTHKSKTGIHRSWDALLEAKNPRNGFELFACSLKRRNRRAEQVNYNFYEKSRETFACTGEGFAWKWRQVGLRGWQNLSVLAEFSESLRLVGIVGRFQAECWRSNEDKKTQLHDLTDTSLP